MSVSKCEINDCSSSNAPKNTLSVQELLNTPLTARYGNKLGIPFMRASEGYINVYVGLEQVEIPQELDDSKMSDAVGIPSVVWDCGLFLVDKLNIEARQCTFNDDTNKILDLGCGTGVVGLACSLLCGGKVTFSDKVMSPTTRAHLEACSASHISGTISETKGQYGQHDIVLYDWAESVAPPISLTQTKWSLIVLADVLYDEAAHEPLLQLLEQLSFSRLILTYKRRAGNDTSAFLRWLDATYYVSVYSARDIYEDNDELAPFNLDRSRWDDLLLFDVRSRA